MPLAINVTPLTGFQPHIHDVSEPLIDAAVASAYATDLYPGDPVTLQTDGTYQRTAAGGGAGTTGVIVKILGYRDPAGFYRRNAKYIPASTTWTAQSDATKILILPVWRQQLFKIKSTTANASEAAARARIGENVDHAFGTASQVLGVSSVGIDATASAVTATLQWRIVDYLGRQISNDMTKVNDVFLVYANVLSGIGGLPANLGT